MHPFSEQTLTVWAVQIWFKLSFFVQGNSHLLSLGTSHLVFGQDFNRPPWHRLFRQPGPRTQYLNRANPILGFGGERGRTLAAVSHASRSATVFKQPPRVAAVQRASVKTHSTKSKHALPSSLNSRHRPGPSRGASVETHSNLPKVDLPSSLNSRQRPGPSRGASVKTHSKMLHCSKPTTPTSYQKPKLHCSQPIMPAAVQKKLGSKSKTLLRAKADKAKEPVAAVQKKLGSEPVAAVQKKLDSRPKAPATLQAKADKAKEPAELSRQKLTKVPKLKPPMINANIPDDINEQIGTSHLPIKPPKVVTLGIDFAGIGLAGLALNQIKKQNPNKFDVQLHWVSEPNPGCQTVLKYMWKDQKHELVVHNSVEDALEERSFVHVHQWSPECQPFSTAGKKHGLSDSRGQLVGAGFKIVMKLGPWVTIMEQSSNLVSKRFRHIAKKIVMRLRNKCGYRVFWKVIHQAGLGIPHSRKRFILVGVAKERYCKTFVWPSAHGNDKKASKWILRPPKPTDKACVLPTCPRQKRVVQTHLARTYTTMASTHARFQSWLTLELQINSHGPWSRRCLASRLPGDLAEVIGFQVDPP